MKRTIILIAIAAVIISSCAKEKRQYELTLSASHGIEQSNICVDGRHPHANYYWRMEDEDGNCVFERGVSILLDTISETVTAESGYVILIYVSVNDVLDIGKVSCTSSDRSVSLRASTDDPDNGDSNSATLKTQADEHATAREIEFKLM